MIDLFKPGSPTAASLSTVTPVTCGGAPNGTACSDGNACTRRRVCLQAHAWPAARRSVRRAMPATTSGRALQRRARARTPRSLMEPVATTPTRARRPIRARLGVCSRLEPRRVLRDRRVPPGGGVCSGNRGVLEPGQRPTGPNAATGTSARGRTRAPPARARARTPGPAGRSTSATMSGRALRDGGLFESGQAGWNPMRRRKHLLGERRLQRRRLRR